MPEKYTTMETQWHVNIRALRAQSVVSGIMEIVGRHAPGADKYSIYRELVESFEKQGVEIVTDHTRQEAGLPPRGPLGWTAAELVALEQARLEALLRPLAVTVRKDDPRLRLDAI